MTAVVRDSNRWRGNKCNENKAIVDSSLRPGLVLPLVVMVGRAVKSMLHPVELI